MTSRAKTVRMPLYDGSLSGMTNLSDSAWERGKMYTAPENQLTNVYLARTARNTACIFCCPQTGLRWAGRRFGAPHQTASGRQGGVDAGRPYDDSLNDFDIDYLEAELIRLAVAAKTSAPDNQNRGNRQNSVRTNWISISTKLCFFWT